MCDDGKRVGCVDARVRSSGKSKGSKQGEGCGAMERTRIGLVQITYRCRSR